MLRILLSLLLASGVVGGALAQSAPGAGTYSATVPVAGTGDAQRDAAIANALVQVLQHVAPGFSASPDLLSQAPGYVRDFRYQRAESGGGLELQVDFDPGAIARLAGAGSTGTVASAGTAAGASQPTATQGGSGNLWVTGIGDSHAFASLLSTLRADGALHDVTPVAADGDGVLLSLDYDQPLATVLAGLTGPGGHFAPDPQPHPGADASLHWLP